MRRLQNLWSDGLPSRKKDDAPTVGALCCTRCDAPIATSADVLVDQIPRLESASYPYELDILGLDDVWVYSATNPHDARFDVARVGGSATGRIRVRGLPSSDHSFFTGYAWSMAECATCAAHVGWAFSEATDNGAETGGGTGSAPPISFAGLVLTHLRERACTQAELDASATRAASKESGTSLLERLREFLLSADELAELEAGVRQREQQQRERAGEEDGDEGDAMQDDDDDDDDEQQQQQAPPVEVSDAGGAPSTAATEVEQTHQGPTGRTPRITLHDEEDAGGAPAELGAVDGLPG